MAFSMLIQKSVWSTYIMAMVVVYKALCLYLRRLLRRWRLSNADPLGACVYIGTTTKPQSHTNQIF
jgi:hypothetical protein